MPLNTKEAILHVRHQLHLRNAKGIGHALELQIYDVGQFHITGKNSAISKVETHLGK